MATVKNVEFIWELIHSLSGSEKRYFKIFINNKKADTDSLYANLYSIIEKQKDGYNEEAVKKQLRKNFKASNFSLTKTHLFELILQSLEAYYAENKTDLYLKRLIVYADLLKQKNITESAFKYLSKAEAIAEKYERLAVLIDIKHKQSFFYLDSGNNEKIEYYLTQKNTEEIELLKRQHEIVEGKSAAAQIHLLYKKYGGLTVREQKEELEKLKNAAVLKDIENLKTFHAKSYAYTVLGVLCSLQKNTEEAFEIRYKLYNLYIENEHFIEDKIQAFAGNLYNLCITGLALKKYDLIAMLVPVLNELPEKYDASFSESNSILTKMRAINLQLLLCAYNNDYNQVAALGEKVEYYNKKYDYQILNDYLITNYLLSAMMLTLKNDYKEALKHINHILNFKAKNFRNDITLYARFVNFVLHYKIGNTELLDYELKNLRYFLGKTFLYPELENRVVMFFSLLINDKQKLIQTSGSFFPLVEDTKNNHEVFDEMLEKILLLTINK